MDKKDTPINPQDYRFGINVVDIGDVRVLRGKSRRHVTSCQHKRMHYDQTERRIWCPDCENDIPAFDAFLKLVGQFGVANEKLQLDRRKLEEAMKFQARSLAAKALDEAWRGRSMVPCCPHCNHGLLPEDFSKGIGMKVSRDYELRRRGKPE